MLGTPGFQRSGWVRVSQLRIRCPICQKPDYCTISADGQVCNCPRTPSDHPIYGRSGEWVGYLHRLSGDGAKEIRIPQQLHGRTTPLPTPHLAALAERCRTSVSPDRLASFARSLGLSAASLARLGCGWADGVPMWRQRVGRERPVHAWVFPMRDDLLRVTGLRLRGDDGRKFSFTGGHEGLFISDGIDSDGPLLLPEGPTSTAACLDLGFSAIGRPNDTGGVQLLCRFLQRHAKRRRDLVVVADNDSPKRRPDGSSYCPGQEGAERCAAELVREGWHVRIIQPPRPDTKDMRDWLKAGATRPVVDCIIRNASYVVAGGGRACA